MIYKFCVACALSCIFWMCIYILYSPQHGKWNKCLLCVFQRIQSTFCTRPTHFVQFLRSFIILSTDTILSFYVHLTNRYNPLQLNFIFFFGMYRTHLCTIMTATKLLVHHFSPCGSVNWIGAHVSRPKWKPHIIKFIYYDCMSNLIANECIARTILTNISKM